MKRIFTFLVTTLLSASLLAQTNTTDSLALVNIYNSTNGSSWTNSTNWLTSSPVSTWFGVTVVNNRVTNLQLSSNNLTGTLSPSLDSLKALVALDLSYNTITGRIPKFDSLSTLTLINLSRNQFTDIAPLSVSNLAALTVFNLDSNQIGGTIAPQLGKFPNLQTLDFGHNQLTGTIPPQLGNLSTLKILNLESNQLTGEIPLRLALLVNLTRLQLDTNQLSGSIPGQLGNLTALTDLYLNSNQFTGTIPKQLDNLVNVDSLLLGINNLTGEIPPSFRKLTSLQVLSVAKNNLTGNIPASFRQLTNLTGLNVSHNFLSGTLPPQLLTLPNFSKLNIKYNNYTFAGLEAYVQHTFTDTFVYNVQNKFDLINNNGTLIASVGGTPSNNTYNWYMGQTLVATTQGDSTFTPQTSGTYYAKVTNSVITDLTLTSNRITVTVSSFAQNDASTTKFVFNASPNPVTTTTKLSFDLTGNCTIKLTNFSGQVLQVKTVSNNQSLNTVQMDLSRYVAGTYFATITNEKNETRTIQLNKQ